MFLSGFSSTSTSWWGGPLQGSDWLMLTTVIWRSVCFLCYGWVASFVSWWGRCSPLTPPPAPASSCEPDFHPSSDPLTGPADNCESVFLLSSVTLAGKRITQQKSGCSALIYASHLWDPPRSPRAVPACMYSGRSDGRAIRFQGVPLIPPSTHLSSSSVFSSNQ